jgi:hypothetical protein
MSKVRAVVYINDGTVTIAERFAVVSPHIELYQSRYGSIIAFVMREPFRDDRGDLWRALVARYVTAAGNKQSLVGHESSPTRIHTLSCFSLKCPDKPSEEECLNDLINNVIQKRLSEAYGIVLDSSRYLLAIDTSPAQLVELVEAFHTDINSMLSAAYAEFQHWSQNIKTLKRLARLRSKKSMNWLAFIMKLFMKLFPLLMNNQHTGEEG